MARHFHSTDQGRARILPGGLPTNAAAAAHGKVSEAAGQCCADPEDLARALSEAAATCTARGTQLTPARRRVLELLLSSHRPVKAYDLIAHVGEGGSPAKPPTVYRALDFLLQNGLAHRIESLNAFIACGVHGCRRAVAFLICEKCGAADERDAGAALADLQGWAGGRNFSIKVSVIEARGLCAACAGAEEAGLTPGLASGLAQ